MPVCHLGIDLAWSERNLSGCVAAGPQGRIVDERLLRTDAEVIEWIDGLSEPTAVVAIDAPLSVPNDAGRRPCESELHRVYGARKAGPHSSNRTHLVGVNGRIRGEDLATALSSRGYGDPWSGARRTLLEVYPHPALIEAFELPERLLYKKGPVARRRAGLQQLDRLVHRLGTADPPLRSALLGIDETVRGRALKNAEDLLDARVCAWIAAVWRRHGRTGIDLYGSPDGHIAVPHVRVAS